MKLISWNVNGLRACVGKGFKEAFAQLDADFFCLQETKMQEGQLDLAFPGYQSYWNSAEKKGYSGTAVFTRHEPLSVSKGIGIEEHDHEGRVLTLEMADFFLVCVYTPNSQDQLRRLSYRMQWEEDFQAYLHRLDSQRNWRKRNLSSSVATSMWPTRRSTSRIRRPTATARASPTRSARR